MARSSQHVANRPKSLTVNEAIVKLLDVSELVGKRGDFKATETKRVKGAFRHLNATATDEDPPRQQHYVKFLQRLKDIAGAAMVALSAAGLGQAAVYSMTDRVRTELPFKILERRSDLQNAVIESLATKYGSSTEPCPGQLVHVTGHISSSVGNTSQFAPASLTDQPTGTTLHTNSRVTSFNPEIPQTAARTDLYLQPSPHSADGSTYFLSLNNSPKLQVSLLQSEPPHRTIDMSITYLMSFLQGLQDLTNLPSTINLLQQYENSCPDVQLKVPLYDAFPSIEIKVTRDLGPTLLLIFTWDIANDLLYSLGTGVANVTD